ASEHDPLVLILQEQLETQKAEQEQLKEDISSKLNAILAFMSRQP
ncbi:hypothetical protein A2U01_0088552, partial [Trifolium medium]|nr:hypothetical protein [Trifolium medium]